MKKLLLLILLAALYAGVAPANAAEKHNALFAKLCEVNRYWTGQENAVPANAVLLHNERAMIRLHLQLVEQALRAKDVSELPEHLQQARRTHLDNLHTYWKAGAFPINTTHAYRLPIFIDPFDNFCAVGYLVKASGNEHVSRKIAANTNFAYLAYMNYQELDVWAANSGLTKDELAWIQPAYAPSAAMHTMLGGTNGTVKALAIDPAQGTVFSAGNFSEVDGMPGANNVAQYGMGFAGPYWSTMAGGLTPTVEALQFFNGDLYAAGADLLPTGAPHAVVKWNGSQWVQTAPSSGMVKALAVYNNELYAAGANGSGSAFLARWNGSLWVDIVQTQGPAVQGTFYTLHVHDNKLFIGGEFTTIGFGTPNILQYNGVELSGVAGGLPAKVRALTTYKNHLFAGGDFVSAQADTFGLARLDGSTWTNLIKNQNGDFFGLVPINNVGFVSSFATEGTNRLMLGGSFNVQPMMGGSLGTNLASYVESSTGTSWGFNGLGILDQPVHALLYNVQQNILYAGGAFTQNISTPVASVGYIQLSPLNALEPVVLQEPSVFPNPFVASATILVPQLEPQQRATLEVYDVLGKKVLEEQQLVTAESTLRLNRNQLCRGTYLLQVRQANNQTGMVRLVVQ